MARDDGDSNAKKHAPLPGESRLHDFVEGLKGWSGLFVIVLLGGGFWAGSRIPAARPILAEVIAFAFPIACAAYVAWEVREVGQRTVRIATFVLAGLLALGTSAMLREVFHPPLALETVTLTPSHPDATLHVPEGEASFEARARGKLLGAANDAHGIFAVKLTRERGEHELSGEFSRSISQTRGVMRSAPQRLVTTTEVVQEAVTLPGHGPIQAHLDSIDGSVTKAVRLSILPVPSLYRVLQWVLVAIAAAGLVLEVLVARKGGKVPVLAAFSAAAFVGIYIAHRFDPDDPLSLVTGGIIAAMIACVLGGFGVGRIAVFMFGPSPTEQAKAANADPKRRG